MNNNAWNRKIQYFRLTVRAIKDGERFIPDKWRMGIHTV
jgi:hypothetical protein